MRALSRFMTAATLAVGVSTSALAQDGEQDVRLTFDGESLMSEQTRELFKLEFWEFVSGLKVPPMLVFSRADFEHGDPVEQQAEHEENFENLRRLGINIPALSQYVYEQFEKHSAHNHNAGAFGHDKIIPILREHGHTVGLDISALSENVRIDVVSVMSDNDVRGFFASMSGIPEELLILKDMPIQDLRAFIMFHEIGHLLHADPDMSTLESEWMAEMYAHKTYKDAYAKGLVSTPDLPILFSQARSMNAFSQGQLSTLLEFSDTLLNFAPDYEMTAIAASYEPEEKPDFKALDANLNSAYRDILLEVGRDISTTSGFEYMVHIAASSKVYQIMLQNEEISPEITENVRQFFINLNTREMEVLDQGIAYKKGERTDLPDEIDYEPVLSEFKELFVFPPKYQEVYDAGFEDYMNERAEGVFLNEGLELARGQSELIYTAARHLLEKGAFDDNRAGAALAENFVRGAETLAPNYFAVDDVSGPTYSESNPLVAKVNISKVPAGPAHSEHAPKIR